MTANIINHIGFVLDESSSMGIHKASVIRVIDNLVAHLARRSQELDQETRVSIWGFSGYNRGVCHVWDRDVLRLPSIATLYNVQGMTALIDGTMNAIRDLNETPQRHGDHSFLVYVATDGEENNSRSFTPSDLQRKIGNLPDNWTLAALVPNATGKAEAKRFGFHAGNVEIWDTTSRQGVEEMGQRIQAATETFMTGRAQGVRSSKSLFTMGDTAVNAQAIAQAGMTPLSPGKYVLNTVPREVVIKDWVEDCGYRYMAGRGYYELVKPEKVQASKDIAIVSKDGREQVWIGREARMMLNLPDTETRVRPDYNANYRVFVQSTSVNRILKPGQMFLYLV
jgi:hypothetical protein